MGYRQLGPKCCRIWAITKAGFITEVFHVLIFHHMGFLCTFSCVFFSGTWVPLIMNCKFSLDSLLRLLPQQVSHFNGHSGFCCCCHSHTLLAPNYTQAAEAALGQVMYCLPFLYSWAVR